MEKIIPNKQEKGMMRKYSNIISLVTRYVNEAGLAGPAYLHIS
jgi:hypothetical protein